MLPAELRGPLMIGFLGSYTTFSTLALEAWRMVEDGAWAQAGRIWVAQSCSGWRRS